MQPAPPFDGQQFPADGLQPTPRARNRKGLVIASLCAAVLVLGILNAKTGVVARALGLGAQPPITFRPSLSALSRGTVVVGLVAVDARAKAVKTPGQYLKRPRVEIFDEDLQRLAAVRLEGG